MNGVIRLDEGVHVAPTDLGVAIAVSARGYWPDAVVLSEAELNLAPFPVQNGESAGDAIARLVT